MEILSYRLSDKFGDLVREHYTECADERDLLAKIETFSGFIFFHGSSIGMEKVLSRCESVGLTPAALCFLSSAIQVLPVRYQYVNDRRGQNVASEVQALYGSRIHSLTYPISTPCSDLSIRNGFSAALIAIRSRPPELDLEDLRAIWDLLDPQRQSIEFIRALEAPIAAGPDSQNCIRQEFLPALSQFRWTSTVKYDELRRLYLQACHSLGKKNSI